MEKAKTYTFSIAGLTRELPLCKVTDDTYIAAFICFGDAGNRTDIKFIDRLPLFDADGNPK